MRGPQNVWRLTRSLLDEYRAHRVLASGYRQFLTRGDLCFDIGANMGRRTGAFLRLGATVVAVEPHPYCAAYLRRRFRRRVVVVEAALGATPGTAVLRAPPQETTCATLSESWIADTADRFPDRQWNEVARVDVRTFDDLARDFGIPTFCKIDVEGSELEVLRGMSTAPRTVALEFVPERLEATREAIEQLTTIGLTEFSYTVGESLDLQGWMDAERLLEQLGGLSRSAFGDVYARSGAN